MIITSIVNPIIARAQSLQDLIAGLKAVNPDLATQLETKPLLYSRTPWGVLVSYLLGLALANYGLNLSPEMTQVVAGGFMMLGVYAMRWITKQPIAGVLPADVPPSSAAVVLALALTACTTTQVVSFAETAYVGAHASFIQYAASPSADPQIVVELRLVDEVAGAALSAYTAAPSPDSKAALEAAVAELLVKLVMVRG